MKTEREQDRVERALSFGVSAAGHAVGVSSCAAVILALGLPEQSLSLALEAVREGFMVGQLKLDGARLLALSVGVWSLVYWGVRQMMSSARGRSGRVRRVALSRGTVMTETLIVIPVYLLVMMGSLQLTQTTMAGLMTTLAAYQAGRTAAIWIPERDAQRNGVTQAIVDDKVRMAAAGVLAPVVPANFIATCDEANASDTLEKMLAGLVIAGNFSGGALLSTRATGLRRDLSVNTAFDSMPMMFRGVPKLTFAYCAQETPEYVMSTENDVPVVSTTITYHHQATLPIVEVIFGDLRTVGNRLGYFTEIKRTYMMPLQIEPNTVSPLE